MTTDYAPPAPLRENDYEVIEAAVMETEKGRWFLAEYARRHRAADTALVLSAIERLEGMLKRERRPDADRIRLDIGEMKDAIDRTKAEIAQLKQDGGGADGNRFERATNELDSIITQTEAATSEILGAAEKLHEISFSMREGGVEAEVCDAVEALVMTIYTACSFQDLTGQRTQKVVHVLRYLETRINAMVEIWGIEQDAPPAAAPAGGTADGRPDAHLLNGPALAGEGIDQSAVDDLMGEVEPVDAFVPDLPASETPVADPFGTDDHWGEEPEIDWAIPQDGADGGESPPLSTTAEDASAAEAEADVTEAAEAEADGSERTSFDGGFERSAAGDSSADRPGDSPEVEPPGDDLVAASAAMETAIGVLRDVSGAVSARAGDDDPLKRLSRAERQALFS